jgi:hypothetical protein
MIPVWLTTLLEGLGMVVGKVRPKRRPKPGPDVRPLDPDALKRAADKAKDDTK